MATPTLTQDNILIGILSFIGGLIPFALKFGSARQKRKDAERKSFTDLSIELSGQLQKESLEIREGLRMEILTLKIEIKEIKEENIRLESENRSLRSRVTELESRLGTIDKKELNRLKKVAATKNKGKK